MPKRLSDILHALRPYRDVLIFVVTLFVANGMWKLAISGDEHGTAVTCCGRDVSAVFDAASHSVARSVYTCISAVRPTAHLIDGHIIRFDSGSATSIVWSCSCVKQLFIWCMLLLTVIGGWRHKIWYIPIGGLICWGFNILRITLIALAIEYHPDWFTCLHDYVFKYLFYGMMFGLWVIFVEYLRPAQP